METKETARKFLAAHGFDDALDVSALADGIRGDMVKGLSGGKAWQDMIRTYFDPTTIAMRDESVIVIDAGGTNFRSCVVKFTKDGKSEVSNFEKTAMPGTDRELGKKEFFARIATNISRLKDSCSEICFCFSYPMTITEDQDGILLGFSKEIKAPEVAGAKIGDELKAALREQGWKTEPKVILLNDTVSALLAGTGSGDFSSYIGFILGTGMNTAYVQPDSDEFKLRRQIIVCESGKYGGAKKSEFDERLDAKSAKPGTSLLEKLCSGAYLGPLGLEVMRTAAEEGLLSKEMAKTVGSLGSFPLIDMSNFLLGSSPDEGRYMEMFAGATADDNALLFRLFDALLDRSARISAALIGACVEQSGGGRDPAKPVRVACNGTTFFKGYKVRERTEKYLAELLAPKGLHYSILGEESDITRGTAMAALR